MQITIYHKHLANSEASKVDDSRVDRIEYAGQTIVFKDGKIYGCLCEEPEEPARRSDMYEDHVVSKMDLPPGKSSYRKKTNMTEHEMGG